MVHNRRARPTIRVLADDLTADWESPHARRVLEQGSYQELHPLSELKHPIIAKARETFGSDPANDNATHGYVKSSTTLPLWEIRASQWRGGVWEDRRTGVRWLVVAGLAKGMHQDHDDFYQQVEREEASGDPKRWLPTDLDVRLLRQESAARLLTEWDLAVQAQMLEALRVVQGGGSTRVMIKHPFAGFAQLPRNGDLALLVLSVEFQREPDYQSDDIILEVVPAQSSYKGTELIWKLTIRALVSLNPPEQAWDRYQDTYATIAEPGTWAARVRELEKLVADNELAVSEPGILSHYAHREHLAGATIEGRAVRGLCGVFFVPTQDHESMPVCPECDARMRQPEA
ncbi:MAG: DUF3039 domain-containing protein [Bifidobacteriaceae bacterium]|jgi:hypothetical protein|nr:DUF3039 domain-containing protein [Bifidobacteriaceae bacterium]